MKNFIIIIALIQLYSCSKDNELQNQLVGEWVWHSTSSGWGQSNPESSGIEWRLSITSANIVSAREGSISLVESSAYKLENRRIDNIDANFDYIETDDPLRNVGGVFRIEDDTLIFYSPGVFDGNSHFFIRLH